MNLKWFVTFITINVVSCMKSIQKITPKYNNQPNQPSNPDLSLTLPSDKNSFPDVVYPTSILDVAKPFYFNRDNYEVVGPFSEDVKSSYKLLSSISKPANKNTERNVKTETKKVVTTPAIDAVTNVSVEENITECHNDSKEVCNNLVVSAEAIKTENNTNSILSDKAQNYDYYNVSMLQEVLNESCSKIPLLVKINIQVLKERSDKSKEVIELANNLSSLDDEENVTHLKQAPDTSGNKSSEEINSSSEERYTELQDIEHSDFIKMLSVLLLDLSISTDNATSEMWNTTMMENEALERIVLESFDNLTNSECLGLMESESDPELFGLMESELTDSESVGLMESELTDPESVGLMESELTDPEPVGLMGLELTDTESVGLMESELTDPESVNLMESDLTDPTTNITYSDLESMLNFTEQFGHSDKESVKNSKEDYFLDLLLSLDSLCENNNNVDTITNSEYMSINEHFSSDNFTIT